MRTDTATNEKGSTEIVLNLTVSEFHILSDLFINNMPQLLNSLSNNISEKIFTGKDITAEKLLMNTLKEMEYKFKQLKKYPHAYVINKKTTTGH